MDVGYWESLLSQLKAFLARAGLRDRHQELLRSKLYKLKLEQLGEESVSSQPVFPSLPRVRLDLVLILLFQNPEYFKILSYLP